MKTKIISIIVIVLVILTNIPSLAAPEEATNAGMRMQPLIDKLNSITDSDIKASLSKYSDIKTHWGSPYIGKLTLLKILEGSNGKFVPDGNINIASFIKITVLALGYNISPSISIKTKWYDSFVKQALADKLISIGEFEDYTKPITREQAAKIMVRAITLKDKAPNQRLFNSLRAKSRDYIKVNDMYKQFMTDAYLLGAFEFAKDGVMNPKGVLTRAQACAVAIRLLDMKARTPYTVAENEVLHIKGTGEHPDSTIEDEFGFMPFTIYPLSNPEIIPAANYLKNTCVPLDKGYASISYSEEPGLIGTGFYKSKDVYKEQDPTKFSMTIGVWVNDKIPTNMMNPYDINIMDCIEVKTLHLDVIISFFKYLFGNDSQKVIALFNKYLSATKSMKDDVVIGNRRVVFSKHDGENGFGLGICAFGYNAK